MARQGIGRLAGRDGLVSGGTRGVFSRMGTERRHDFGMAGPLSPVSYRLTGSEKGVYPSYTHKCK